jgi:glycosyltransferase involved in cell wall biosynthesis
MMVASFVHAARDAARDADVVHAHWLPSGWVAARTDKPFVVTLHGTDVELAQRLPRFARAVFARAAGVVAVSSSIADSVRTLGARQVQVIPNGIDVPPAVGAEAEPPYVLFAGRLSIEKGVLELVDAARGLPLVVVGDGPLRRRVPQARGFVARDELVRLLDQAAVVVCPSRREGFGMACLEAMAHGKPVVATDVGGLRDLVVDGETGIVVPPRNTSALRAAIELLLGNADLRARLGAAGHQRAFAFDWTRVIPRLLAMYEQTASVPSAG